MSTCKSTSRKVVVVTGASRGMGAAIVRAFRELDCAVVATSRSIGPSDDANLLTVAGDIGDPATARRVIAEGVARFGRIDTLVNNAGIYIGRPFTEHTAEDYAAVMNVNMAGFYYITQLAIAEMEKHSSGHVVSITASIDQVAISGVYSVLAALTKGGINAATKSLAIEYAKKGIRVNAVAPGNMDTPMHAPEIHEALRAFNPVGRLGETSDIADAVVFLDSAPFITGEILHVDGGQSAGH
ncbi:SDR family NAD(P)-dependent oxidoreductase [Paraburkholderia terrae]|uniref:SDR family NAD(P)-dependent oxidoreductase n=1 Tax=Paraburkholderia terrae TaxID=311230 RepID=UPI0025460684|nr:SDR family oxidoreductase [Paraburkholderia terrae]